MRSLSARTTGFLIGLVAGAAIVVTPTMSGCAANTKNDPEFVDAADRFVNDTVGPEYERMLDGDFDPSELSPDEIADRKANVNSFRAVVDAAKDELEDPEILQVDN